MKKFLFAVFVLCSMHAAAQAPSDTAQLRQRINEWISPNGNKQITAQQVHDIFIGIANLMKAYAADSAYRIADTLFLVRRGGFTTIKVTLNSGGVSTETDPTVSAAAKTITNTDKTNWNNKQDPLTAGTGITIVANVISAQTTTALWNANKIQGSNVSTTAPLTGQVLKWNGTAWEPANESGGGGSLPNGGTINQALAKNSSTDGDASWKTVDKSYVGLGNVQNVDQTNAANITIGSLPNARLNFTGVPDGAKFLRDDFTWATPPGGGSGDNWGTDVVNHDITLTGNGTSGSPLKADSAIIETKAGKKKSVDSAVTVLRLAMSDSLILAVSNMLIPARIEFVHAGASSTTYQNDTLIGKQLVDVSIEGYKLGFTARSTSVYMEFDTVTGTITLHNGEFIADDFILIIYRTPPIFMLDGAGKPVRDGSGNFIILN